MKYPFARQMPLPQMQGIRGAPARRRKDLPGLLKNAYIRKKRHGILVIQLESRAKTYEFF